MLPAPKKKFLARLLSYIRGRSPEVRNPPKPRHTTPRLRRAHIVWLTAFVIPLQVAFAGRSRTRRASLAAPVRAAYKGVVSKADANYNHAALSQLLTSPACKWTYNYGTAPQGVPDGMTFVPMVFGHDQFKTNGDLTASAYSELQTYGKNNYIIGFNEPDGDARDQSKIQVDQAILYWDKVILRVLLFSSQPIEPSVLQRNLAVLSTSVTGLTSRMWISVQRG